MGRRADNCCRSLLERSERADAIKATIAANADLDENTRRMQLAEVDDTYTTPTERQTLAKYDEHMKMNCVRMHNLDYCLFVAQFHWHNLMAQVDIARRANKKRRTKKDDDETPPPKVPDLISRWWND